jgi:hypothetical protein
MVDAACVFGSDQKGTFGHLAGDYFGVNQMDACLTIATLPLKP